MTSANVFLSLYKFQSSSCCSFLSKSELERQLLASSSFRFPFEKLRLGFKGGWLVNLTFMYLSQT